MSSPRTMRLVGFVLFGLLVGPCVTAVATANDWTYAAPEEQGIDSGRLEQMREIIDGLELPIDSVVVIRSGQIVFEHYPDPIRNNVNRKHNLYSTTKSVTSILIGIAIDMGFIESVDQRVIDFFPDRKINNVDERKRCMTLEHLLTMTSGLEWEGPDDIYHSWGRAIMSGDPVQYTLDQPMAHEPGEVWYYNGGCSHVLSAILTKTTGMSTLQFARQHLFGPLGITRVRWPRDPNGIYYGGQDIWLTPHGMAKLGQFYLDSGIWQGEQIVSSEWVDGSTQTHAPSWWGGYGYQWWTFPEAGIFFAAGAFEQRIYVSPELDLVVVFTSSNMAEGTRESAGERTEGPPIVDWLLGGFILPSCNTYEPTEYKDFGFSLTVPQLTRGRPEAWIGSDRISDASGLVSFSYIGSPFVGAGVQWQPIEESFAFEAALEGFVATVRTVGVQVVAIGLLKATVHGGRVLVYRRVDFTTQDGRIAGVVGVLFSEANDRAYVLYYVPFAGLSEWIDPVAGFKEFFRGFDPRG